MNYIKKCFVWALAAATAVFTFVPDSVFAWKKWVSQDFIDKLGLHGRVDVDSLNISISKVAVLLLIMAVICFATVIARLLFGRVLIKGDNYTIQIEYGDILKTKNCKRVINFDECYSTTVGEGPSDVKKSSICGQYLTRNEDLDIKELIKKSGLVPLRTKSLYQGKERYESGSIVPNGDDLLLAFAKLDKRGCACRFSRKEYLETLEKMWEEIDAHYAQKDVCIPVLGAGLTRMEDYSGASVSTQKLLELIVLSYKISSYKIKSPYKLRIICKKQKDFSIYKNVN